MTESILDFFFGSFLGRLLVIWAVIYAAQKIYDRIFLKRKIRKVVANANDNVKKAFNPEAEQVPVDLRSIPGLDYAFYENITQEMAALGFTVGDDLENPDLTAMNPWLRTAERPFFNKEGAIAAGCFHLKTRGWRRILTRMIGGKADVYTINFLTWLEDGAVIGTCRTNMLSPFSHPGDIYGVDFPPSTALTAMLENHKEQVRRVIEERKVKAWRPIRNVADFIAYQQHYNEKIAAHREQQGSISVDEFAKLTENLDPETQKLVLEEAGKGKASETRQPQWENA